MQASDSTEEDHTLSGTLDHIPTTGVFQQDWSSSVGGLVVFYLRIGRLLCEDPPTTTPTTLTKIEAKKKMTDDIPDFRFQ